ncbi:MAG TPA: trimethylamine methyltransferase family protein, partial [Kiloniellaceae bacterium]
MTAETGRRRARQGAGARAGAGSTRGAGGLKQLAWRVPQSPYRPLEVLTPEQIETISDAAFRILEEIGMDFLHPEALDILARAGATVTPGSQRVRLDRGLVKAAL